MPLSEARLGHLQRAVAAERSRLDSLLKAAVRAVAMPVMATKKKHLASASGSAVPPDAVDRIGCGLAAIVCIARDVAASAGRSPAQWGPGAVAPLVASVVDAVAAVADVAEYDAALSALLLDATGAVDLLLDHVTCATVDAMLLLRCVGALADCASCPDQRIKTAISNADALPCLHAALLRRIPGELDAEDGSEPRLVVQFFRLLGNTCFGSGPGSAAAVAKDRWFSWATATEDTGTQVARHFVWALTHPSHVAVRRWAAHAVANVTYGSAPNAVQRWLVLRQGTTQHDDVHSAIITSLHRTLRDSSPAAAAVGAPPEPWQTPRVKTLHSLLEAWVNLVFRLHGSPPPTTADNESDAPAVDMSARLTGPSQDREGPDEASCAQDVLRESIAVILAAVTASSRTTCSNVPAAPVKMRQHASLAEKTLGSIVGGS